MPELPEVETVVRDLRPLVVGRTLERLSQGDKQLRRPWLAEWTPAVLGRRVTQIRRRGKWIMADLDGGATLVVHLGMTGQFTVEKAATPAASHTHLIFALDNGDDLRFRDIRRFGSVELFPTAVSVEKMLGEKLGPEPFDLEPKAWRQALRQTKRPLKAALLDQALVAGVGNIYADEALYLARLPPMLSAAATTAAQAVRS